MRLQRVGHDCTHTHTIILFANYKKYKIQTNKYKQNAIYVSFKKRIVKMSLHLKTVFRLNIFTLQAFFYVFDDGLEIADYKFG